jgi:hypothetical protein
MLRSSRTPRAVSAAAAKPRIVPPTAMAISANPKPTIHSAGSDITSSKLITIGEQP